MNERIRELMTQIKTIEDEIEDILRTRQETVLYRLKDGKIKFSEEIEAAQKKFKQGLLHWMIASRPRILVSFPFIYGMIVPIVFFDISISLYQSICFPLYKINKVKRNNYIHIDRHHLHYLNSIERMHCTYCAYTNGLLAYAREIAARTELFWCPIKHASRVLDKHSQYNKFIEYDDAEGYKELLTKFEQEFDTKAEAKS